MNSPSQTKKVIIDVNLQTKEKVYEAYMPFLMKGGLYIISKTPYEMNDFIFIRLKLPNEETILPIVCQVAWLKPARESKYGIGLQFTEANEPAKNKIENLLAGLLNSDRPTDTM